MIRSDTRPLKPAAPVFVHQAPASHMGLSQRAHYAARASSDLLFAQPSSAYSTLVQTAPIPIPASPKMHPRAPYLPPVNCKMRLPASQVPPALRDHAKYRFSALYNAVGEPLLLSQSIAQGTTGKIRVARDVYGQYWAVKCFRTDALPIKESVSARGHAPRAIWCRERILAEARTMCEASSDIQVREVIEAHGKLYLVHTLGQSELAALIVQTPNTIKIDAIHLAMRALGEKLQILHAAGFVHGDTKVHNALFDHGEIMLCDFGTTRKLGPDGRMHPSLSSTYPSPEQANGWRFGTANDIWSLGASYGDLFALQDRNLLGHEHTFEDTSAHLKQFVQWRATLFNADGRFSQKRLMADGTAWGHYFKPRMQLDAHGTTFALVRMLEPNARKRATARQVAEAFFPSTTFQQFDHDTARRHLRRAAQRSKVSRTVRHLEHIHSFNQSEQALEHVPKRQLN